MIIIIIIIIITIIIIIIISNIIITNFCSVCFSVSLKGTLVTRSLSAWENSNLERCHHLRGKYHLCNKQKCPNAFTKVNVASSRCSSKTKRKSYSKQSLQGNVNRNGNWRGNKNSFLYNISYPHNCIALRGLQPSNCRLNRTSSQPLTDLLIDNRLF